MKAQSPIFEQVMLFAISVAIFVACFAMFKVYEMYFTDASINDQLDEVEDYIVSNILIVSKREDNLTKQLEIPKSIANQPYEISLSDKGLNITLIPSNSYTESELYNLTKPFKLRGKAASSYGKYMIYKKGNEIIIE